VVVAFQGGKLPLLPWHIEGGVVAGLTFMFFGVPLMLSVAYVASLILAAPLLWLLRKR
jgi:hypothetical protein